MDLNPLNMFLINIFEDLEEGEDAVANPDAFEIFEERNPFEYLSEEQFVKSFRLTKELVTEVINLVTPYIPNARTSALTVEKKVLI